VYCCTVPNHLLLVRREGKPIWSGNSGGGYGPIVASGNIASGLEAKKSIGITDFAEAPICLAGFIAWVALKGWVTPPLGLLIPLSVGAFIGGLLGPILLSKSKSNLLLARIVAALAIVSGVLLIGLGL
jgi:uncharacterized membrane protein YfcA